MILKYDWNPDKNELLKKERNISFEQIIFHLSQGDVWQIADHPDQKRYPNQKIYFVIVEDYIYLVPHIITKDYIFLKTIIPSRKATKEYKQIQEGK
ncbi:toxin [Candidatus Margulisiibacteriota bacterium]